MKINVETIDITTVATPALVVNLFSGVEKPGGATGAVDQSLDGAIRHLIEDGEIKGKQGELTLLHTMGKIGPARVLVAGLGEQEDFDALRQAQGGCPPRVVRGAALPAAARHLRGGDHRPHACTGAGGRRGIVSCDSRSPGEAGRAIAEGALLGLYRFDRYRANGDGSDSEFAELTIALRQAQDKHGERDGERAESIRDGVAQGQAMAEATLIVRTSTGATWSMNRPTP